MSKAGDTYGRRDRLEAGHQHHTLPQPLSPLAELPLVALCSRPGTTCYALRAAHFCPRKLDLVESLQGDGRGRLTVDPSRELPRFVLEGVKCY
jgi:hypothetical protein